MSSSASLQIPSQDPPPGPRPVSAAVQPTPPPPSSSRRQQRASHTVVSPGASSRDDVPLYTDVYSHPAAVAYATAHPRRSIPKFGPYLLLQTLGEGEFGKVKLGLHSQWGEEVAVKLIRRGNVDNSVRMSKVEREIEVLRTLKHPNIVRLYDVIETDKYIGIILEYASGGELFDHILAHRYLRERDAAKLFSQLISGVWYIHQKKIVHRDLKLENLLLDRHRNVIITDFGFANRFEHRADDLMQTSCGSPCYAAPELVISEGLYVGSAVDIWSCGVILYAMLAGYLPFDDDPANPDGDNINLLYKYIVNTPLSFPEYISPEARDLLGIMLVPDPVHRSSLDAVMRHPWLAAYATPKDPPPLPAPGVPAAFGRSVEQLERAALDQHQQRRLAYQRQMRAAAQSAQQQQQQQAVGAAPVGRSQSHHIPTAGSGHRHAATESPGTTSGRSQSIQSEFLYDSADRSVSTSPQAARRQQPQGLALGGDDDPFGPPPSASVGKTPMLAADAVASPKGHKVNGGGSGSGSGGGGFRHTIQVEYDEPRSHGRSGSHGQRRSEDREGRTPVQHEQQPQPQPQPPSHQQQEREREQQPQQQQRQNGGPPVVSPVPKERRPSQGSIRVSPAKPLPSPPPSAPAPAPAPGPGPVSTNGTPSSVRALPSPAAPISTSTSTPAAAAVTAAAPGSPRAPERTPTKSSRTRTPSTPLPTPATPNINVATASPPDTPIRFSARDQGQVNGVEGIEVEDRDRERERGRGPGAGSKGQKVGRASLDKLGLGKMFGGGGGSSATSTNVGAGGEESSPGRVPSESGKSESGKSTSRSSVLLSPPGKEGKEGKEKEGKEKEGKKSRRNTLTVMVEPFRSSIRNRSAKSRTPSTGEPPASALNGKEREKDKDKGEKSAKTLHLPHSALVRSGGEKSSAAPAQTFAGATGEIGVEGAGGVGMQASTSKARKVMAWFRGRSRVRDGGSADEEEQEPRTAGLRSATPTQAEYVARSAGGGEEQEKRLPVQVVVTTPTSSASRMPSSASSNHPQRPQRTPSTATADTSFTATTSGTPSLVTRFRNSVTIGGHKDRDRDPRLNASASAPPAVPPHPWAALRTHHGAVDQSTITTRPPPEVMYHVRVVLEGMGVEIQVESEYKLRCVRAKRRKGSMVLGGGSTPPLGALGPAGGAGGSLAAVTMVGSAASNGVDKRGLPLPSPSSFSAPGGMLRGLLMRRQSSQVSSAGIASPLDDDIPSPLATEPGAMPGATTYGDPAQDAGDEVKFSVELTRIDRLTDTFSLDIRRMKGNLRSYKFLYDTLRDRADLQR